MAKINPYAEKLLEFESHALGGEAIFKNKGKWPDYFENKLGRKPERVIYEIGCSNAEYLLDIAKHAPSTLFVGIDWKYKVLYKGAKRIAKHKANNVCLLRGLAQTTSQIFSPNEIDEIWILFPDPWAKKTQLKNRLMGEAFLKQAFDVLKPRGKIMFKTDHPGYFQWVLALFGQDQPDLPEYQFTPTSERGMHIRQQKVRKTMQPSELPSKNEVITTQFKVIHSSIDFWSEPSSKDRLISKRLTLFEKNFVEQNLPIYSIELEKK